MTDSTRMPLRRTEALKVVELEGETLVYDLSSHRSHCLNQTAALVWQQCDGHTPVADVVTRLSAELPATLGEDVVALALKQLAEKDLVQGCLVSVSAKEGLSRREMLGRLARVGATAAALPVIASLVAPGVAEAQSPSPTATPTAPAAPTSTSTPTSTMPPTATTTPTATMPPTSTATPTATMPPTATTTPTPTSAVPTATQDVPATMTASALTQIPR